MPKTPGLTRSPLTCPGTVDGTIQLDETLTITSEIAIDGNGYTISGGANQIFHVTSGLLTLIDLTMTDGYSAGNGGAIAIENAALALFNSVVKDSGAQGRGGGIYASNASLELYDSVVSSNVTGPSAADVQKRIEEMNKQEPEDGTDTEGDAQSLEAQTENSEEEVVEEVVDEEITVDDSNGAGIYFEGASNGLTIVASGLDSNEGPGKGGGLYLASGEAAISDSTISLNRVDEAGGAVYNEGTLVMKHVTVVGNSAAEGGGLLDQSQLQLYNSILHDNAGMDCVGALNANINNIISDGSCNHDWLTDDPNLLLLEGSPMYYLPQAGSIAIDAASADHCTEVDQRGITRIPDACDIGAAEHQAGVFRFQIQSALAALEPPESGGGSSETEEAVVATPVPAATPVPSTCERLSSHITVSGYYNSTGCNVLDAMGVGNQTLIDNGFIYAVDIHGAIPAGLTVCFQQNSGAIVILDAANAPRNIVPLRTYTNGDKKCAAVDRAGSAVLMPLNFFTSGAITEPTWDLTGCTVTTTDILNLRAGPSNSHSIVANVLNDEQLTADRRATYYYRVNYYDVIGWLSSDYLSFSGSCE